MSNFPLIRTAIHFCLIATIVVQPTAMVAAQGTCAQNAENESCCHAKSVCSSCQCCEVAAAGDRCGCCNEGDHEASDPNTKQPAAPDADEQDADDSGRDAHGMKEQVGRKFDIVDEPSTAINAVPAQPPIARSACRCGVHSEPAAPPVQRVPVSQPRELVVIAYLDHLAADSALSCSPKPATSRQPVGDLAPHFSQRFLCIWRI
ncbi:hypothetical protein [Allorhodopirellula solitaria]|uniref:hypothetical protein n=1 Tax=Allorhodopirellula solitaria TaxID=2527987 RepID=UPI0011B7E41F|nr:hypothetical protein [Allorhodopirellula solitaria]